MPPFIAWIGVLAMAALIGFAVWQSAAFHRLGSRLAGDHRRDEAVSTRAASTEGVTRVAELAATVADAEEVRAIRWTPARAANGARLALGTSPNAWYLWLLEPEVLIRVPDALVASVDREPTHGNVVRLACRTRSADEVVVATDGTVVEEAADSAALAAELLTGLVIVDPEITEAPGFGERRAPRRQVAAAFNLAS